MIIGAKGLGYAYGPGRRVVLREEVDDVRAGLGSADE